jgi:hypothetical protein
MALTGDMRDLDYPNYRRIRRRPDADLSAEEAALW